MSRLTSQQLVWWHLRGIGATAGVGTDELLDALDDDDLEVAAKAARELGLRTSEARRSAVPLTSALKRGVKDAEGSLRAFGLDAMPALIDCLHDGDRNQGIELLLGELASREGGLEAALALVPFARKDSERLFELRETILSRSDPVGEAIVALQSNNPFIRLSAIVLLEQIAPVGDEEALVALARMHSQPSNSLEDWPIARALARIRGEPAPMSMRFID